MLGIQEQAKQIVPGAYDLVGHAKHLNPHKCYKEEVLVRKLLEEVPFG